MAVAQEDSMDAHGLAHDDRDDDGDYEVPGNYDADDWPGSVRVTIRAVFSR